jgi:hypothetical protein
MRPGSHTTSPPKIYLRVIGLVPLVGLSLDFLDTGRHPFVVELTSHLGKGICSRFGPSLLDGHEIFVLL